MIASHSPSQAPAATQLRTVLLSLGAVGLGSVVVREMLAGSFEELGRLEVMLTLAMILASCGCLALWGVAGRAAWPRRLSGVVLGASLLVALLLRWEPTWELTTIGLVQFCSLLVIATVARSVAAAASISATRSDSAETTENRPRRPTRHFSIANMLAWTTVTAVAVAVVQWLEPEYLPTAWYPVVAIRGLCFAGVSATAAWSVSSDGFRAHRYLGLLIAVPLLGWIAYELPLLNINLNNPSLVWYEGLVGMQALLTMIVVATTRHGWLQAAERSR